MNSNALTGLKKRQYGRTDLWVSELCLGVGRIGCLSDCSSAYEVLDAYVEYGGNFIQVSSRSCLPLLDGDPIRTESMVGDWLRGNSSLRASLVISARIRCPKDLRGLELEGSIRLQIEEVMKRLGARYLDIVLLDWSTGFFPTYEVMTVMGRLADAGLLRFVGSIGFPCWRIAEWLGRGSQATRIRLESAHLDGPLTHCCLEELAREHRVSLVVRWPFSSGYEPLFSTAKEVFGRPSFQIGMAWLFSRPSVCSVQFSPKLKSQLVAAVEAARFEMSAGELAKVGDAYRGCSLPPYCPTSNEFVLDS